MNTNQPIIFLLNVAEKIEMETEGVSRFGNLFECTICTKRYGSAHNARRHILVVHMKKGNTCPTCGLVTYDGQSLRRHISKCPANRKHFMQIKNLEEDAKVKVSSHSNRNSPQGRGSHNKKENPHHSQS